MSDMFGEINRYLYLYLYLLTYLLSVNPTRFSHRVTDLTAAMGFLSSIWFRMDRCNGECHDIYIFSTRIKWNCP